MPTEKHTGLLTAVVFGWGIACLVAMAPAPANADSDVTIGEWRTPDNFRVQVQRCADTVCARIVRMPDPTVRDVNNPEPRLRVRPVLGIQIFTAQRHTAADGWKGHMYMPRTGSTHVARLTPVQRNELTVSICGPMGLFCIHETWTRTR